MSRLPGSCLSCSGRAEPALEAGPCLRAEGESVASQSRGSVKRCERSVAGRKKWACIVIRDVLGGQNGVVT